MGKSRFVRLYKYTSIFGRVWWLTEAEGEAKLAKEEELYERWKDRAEGIQKPHLERGN